MRAGQAFCRHTPTTAAASRPTTDTVDWPTCATAQNNSVAPNDPEIFDR